MRYFQPLDPRRSLATAVAWLAVALSLATALALLAVGDFASNSMLAQRDAQMTRFASEVHAEMERTLGAELTALRARSAPQADPSSLRAAAAAAVPRSSAQLAAAVDRARARTKPDPRSRVLLLGVGPRVLFEHPVDAQTQAPVLVLPGVTIHPAGENKRLVLATAPRGAADTLGAFGLQVVVVQPSEERGHGGILQEKLSAISILLSISAALVGAAFARRLTRRLSDLTAQVRRVANQTAAGIVEPEGRDEVAMLGRAFSRLLQALRKERDELDQLTRELEQRVQARTREVERLAADSRYAAVVRERLRLARDLHDTLAHSMMEMLVEVRTLRMLHAHDPQRLADELERAEEVARRGLKEAREAVGQMRLNAVRDLGLGAALSSAVNRFVERTGLEVHFDADAQAASFADARAEGVFRIAEEALRNIDHHAHASHVDVKLQDLGDGTIRLTITDDGVGFDPAAPHPGHYGVLGIREQAQLIDAELELQSAQGAGATLRLRLRVGPEMRTSGDEAEPQPAHCPP